MTFVMGTVLEMSSLFGPQWADTNHTTLIIINKGVVNRGSLDIFNSIAAIFIQEHVKNKVVSY